MGAFTSIKIFPTERFCLTRNACSARERKYRSEDGFLNHYVVENLHYFNQSFFLVSFVPSFEIVDLTALYRPKTERTVDSLRHRSVASDEQRRTIVISPE